MPQVRRRFGRLFYVTIVVALGALATLPFWQTAIEQSRAWGLTRQLHDQNEVVRRRAVDGLLQLGPAASPWVIGAMRDRDAQVRALATSIVASTAPEAVERPLAALAVAIKDPDPTVRAAAIGQLEHIVGRPGLSLESPVVDRCVKALCSVLNDQTPPVRMAVEAAIWNPRLWSQTTAAELERALEFGDKPLRVFAAHVLLHS